MAKIHGQSETRLQTIFSRLHNFRFTSLFLIAHFENRIIRIDPVSLCVQSTVNARASEFDEIYQF
jgi:hypothetical protein